ncbi:MAG: hypothetical protein IJV13_00285 [Prevotella sp.]|nr:hypothetical protein [Prevotella sp.]MBQ9650646.1 hypothetical protein [Prevotella sp.]
MAGSDYSANYGYDPQIADVIRPLGQGTVKKTENGFRTVQNVEVGAGAKQDRVDTYKLATGVLVGTQQVKGQIQVVDSNGRKVMVMGYGKDKF